MVSSVFTILLILVFLAISSYIAHRRSPEKKKSRLRAKNLTKIREKTTESEKKKNPLVEYPSYNLSANMPMFVARTASPTARKPNTRIQSYNYDDLRRVVQEKDKEFFVKASEAKKAAFQAKKDIYTRKLIEAQHRLASLEYDPTSRYNEYNEAMEKHKRIIGRCELILDAIDHTDFSPNATFADYRQILWDSVYGLETIVGCLPAKDSFAKRLFAFVNNPSISYSGLQNRLILGPSGIGKSTLTRSLSRANALSGLTIMGRNSEPKELSQSDMESPFIGGTTKKVVELFIDSLDEVMNADELYSLATKIGTASYGTQAINAIVALTSEYEGISHLYAIGYVQDMTEEFLAANQGLDRRFPEKLRILLEPYTAKELSEILIRYLINQGQLDIGDESASTIYSAITTVYNVKPEAFRLQASSVVEIGRHINDTIKGAKNNPWIPGKDKENAELLLSCINEYMAQYNKIHLTSI